MLGLKLNYVRKMVTGENAQTGLIVIDSLYVYLC